MFLMPLFNFFSLNSIGVFAGLHNLSTPVNQHQNPSINHQNYPESEIFRSINNYGVCVSVLRLPSVKLYPFYLKVFECECECECE